MKHNRSTDIGDVILRRCFCSGRSCSRFVFSIAMIGFYFVSLWETIRCMHDVSNEGFISRVT